MRHTMIENVLIRDDPDGERLPLVFDSPHSGLHFPEDFRPAIPLGECAKACDRHVEDLFAAALDCGGVLIQALFARAYLDPNRDTADLDTAMIEGDWPHPVTPSEKASRGASLIWRSIGGRRDIYDRKLSVAEVEGRIARFWRPYHDAVRAALDESVARFGRVLHVNCHSMPEMGDTRWGDAGQRRPDFIIGTRDGTTAGPDFTEIVVSAFRGAGYAVTVNDRFKGVELVRRYGDPAAGRESLQIEINRGLYMDEATGARKQGYDATKRAVTAMIAALATHARATA